jgi:hypothetical protein
VTFDVEAFVAQCQHAASQPDPSTAVRAVVAAAITDGPSIDAALGGNGYGLRETWFVSPALTVQRIGWPPGIRTGPHEHRMWAVVGVYVGTELNRLFHRTSDGLIEHSVCHVGQGEVLVLDDTAIHSVANPCRGRTVGLHVYGGDIVTTGRSEWDPNGNEVPFGTGGAAQLAMFRTVTDIAATSPRHFTADDLYNAYSALCSACEQQHRYLSADEAQQIVATTWHL